MTGPRPRSKIQRKRRSPPPRLPQRPPCGGCGTCEERPAHRRPRRNGESFASCGAWRIWGIPDRPQSGLQREQRRGEYRQRASRFLQAFPDGMSYHSLWDCCPQSKNVCSHRTRGAAAPQGSGHAIRAVRGCENPCLPERTGRGPAPASRGLSVKISPAARRDILRQKTGNGTNGPASPKFTVSMPAAKPAVISRHGFRDDGGMA